MRRLVVAPVLKQSRDEIIDVSYVNRRLARQPEAPRPERLGLGAPTFLQGDDAEKADQIGVVFIVTKQFRVDFFRLGDIAFSMQSQRPRNLNVVRSLHLMDIRQTDGLLDPSLLQAAASFKP